MIPNFPFFGSPYYSQFRQGYRYGKSTFYPPNRPNSYVPNDFKNINSVNSNFNNNKPSNYSENNKARTNYYNQDNITNSKSSNNFENNSSAINDTFIGSSNDRFNSEYNQYIDIFGFKLYFDDILIILILFFLYQEEIKDSYLYIILILLLIG